MTPRYTEGAEETRYRVGFVAVSLRKETVMRNLATALAMLAVLTFASTVCAEVWTFAEKVPDPVRGLETWIFGVTGMNALQDIEVYGVHQVSVKTPLSFASSVFLDDLIDAGVPWEVIDVDTHFLFSRDDILVAAGAMRETNDGENPYDLDTYYGNLKYGFGTFGGDLAFAFKGDAVVHGVDLMQVVVPTGCGVVARATAVDVAAPGRPMVPIEWIIGIPEPGTIASLITGAACLVVARFRRRGTPVAASRGA
jgi:hypothetical protein